MSPRRHPPKGSPKQPPEFSAFAKAFDIMAAAKKQETIGERKVILVHDGMSAEQMIATTLLIGLARTLAMDPEELDVRELAKNRLQPLVIKKDPVAHTTSAICKTGPGPDQNFTFTLDHKKRTTEIKMPVIAEGEALGTLQIQEQLKNIQLAIVNPDRARGLLKPTKVVNSSTHTEAGNIRNVTLMEFSHADQAEIMYEIIDHLSQMHGNAKGIPQILYGGFSGSTRETTPHGPTLVVPKNIMEQIRKSEPIAKSRS